MTPAEYKASRNAPGLTQSELASVLDVGHKMIIGREKVGGITTEAALAISLLELRHLERLQRELKMRKKV